MKLHLPSFLIGYVAGGATVLLGKQVRPLLVELATAAYRLLDAVAARVATRREDIEDLFAEARARARRAQTAQAPEA